MTIYADTWDTIGSMTADRSDPQLCEAGVVHPELEVTLTRDHDGTPVLVLSCTGPEGDDPEPRMSVGQARKLAEVLNVAADQVEAV